MSIESHGPQFTPEHPPKPEVSQAERDLNEIIPILAHGLVRRIEQKGFSGKVRVQAVAGDSWGVAKSPDNSTDIPNVIIYPRESLAGDRRVVNAQLRHEIGNLNYPIDSELNALRGWCYENKIAPELLTSLVEVTHEASVNYLEMQNSHSDQPEENFRALYEQEINTQEIANGIPQSAPYKQAVDLTLLYSLSQVGLVKPEQFEQALGSAHPAVQEIFDKQTRSVLDQSVKMAVPKKQVQLVRDFIWPKFSKLVALSGPSQTESESGKTGDKKNDKKSEMSPEASARAQQAKEIQERMQKLMEKMKQKPQSKAGKKPSQESQNKQKKESKQPRQQELSPAEKQERKDEENLLAENLQEQLQQAKEQLEKLQKPGQQPEAPKPQKPSSMQEIGEQAEQMKAEAEKAMQEAKAGADEITEEQLQKLKEQLEQLEEVAKQIAESGALEEELAKPEEEPITYNIKEYGINEAELTPEQLGNLQKTRSFAQNTSKVYRTAMRLLMTGYQQKNPKFTDKMMQKMMERGYDLPDFSLYGSRAAEEFLSKQQELGIDGFSDNFLVNFQLPRPLAKFWYKGGNGSKSVPIKEGEIEWGHFYRMCMPVIYSGVDRSQMSGLYLNRLNQFGQHDPKKYYYLWEAINTALENQDDESGESDESEDSEKDKGDQESESENGESGEGQEQGSESGQEEGQGEGAGEGGSQGGQPCGEMGGGEGGEPGGSETGSGMPSAQEMQEMLSQMQDMLNEAKEQGGQGGMPGAGQEAIDQLLEKRDQMQQSLESGGSPQEMAGQMQDAMQQLSEMMGGEPSQGEGQGEGSGESGESSGEGSGESTGESSEQSHDQFQKGGQTNEKAVEGMFSKPNEELLKQLRQAEEMVGSKFTTQDESGNLVARDMSQSMGENLKTETSQLTQAQAKQMETLEELKRQQQSKMEAMYREMSGLDGEALRVYVDYMESTKDFINDLKDFFIEKFKLDKEYLRERNQRRGARLQRGFTQNILGEKEGRTVISPRSFERKRPPEKPQLAWTLVIDNSGSCGGEIIEQEKKLAVALVEVAKELDIPLEIVTFGGPDQFTFFKGFEQDISGDDLQKMVLLNADQGTPDVITLEAACTSMGKFTDKFKRSYNFVYFMTDGQSSKGSIQEVIKRHKKDMVITGIGMAGAAQTIAQTWGKNAVEVPDVKRLSDAFIRKVEDQIDSTFD
ncbi:MAG: hypothetical protein KJ760_19645 [Proteobacteria bacterium]|nr:hypothetical protein [Nanoarchaeota archaeon]MBU2483304.1 hypothetical protein [Pseudomonadota bacterium]